LLIDPYAKQLVGELKWSEALFGYTIGHPDDDLSFDERDSAPFVPKCKVIDPAYTWGREQRVNVPWDKTIFYETHTRGFTMRHPSVPDEVKGTFSGLMVDDVIQHIKGLGVTSIELLPIHAFVNDQHLLEKGMTNYWGYNTLAFFAPDPRYLAHGKIAEFKEMVAHMHHAGLEVILDVVYNHTAEGNERGPTLSMRGIDNASYYRLMPDDKRYYINDSGTGNTLDLSHPCVLQMVTDSLRYWATDMHVDGFRFDLATILGRYHDGFSERHSFLVACRQDPVLREVKLIAEPWDCGPGGYQVGNFAPGWAEWNDKFRDNIRAFWKGDEGQLADFANRMTASGNLFNQRGRRPYASVNFITAHDGFTLHDLVSYNDKHNEDNDENNQDGSNDNRSWNCGVEGPTDDPEINALRLRQMRNFFATLLFAQGTPMVVAGDEFARTQHGNNNAYCQDSEIGWVNWDLDEDGKALLTFVKRLIKLRQSHPILRRSRFLVGDYNEELGVKDVTWLSPSGDEMSTEQWEDPNGRCLGMLLDGRAQETGIRRRGSEATLLLVVNSHHDGVNFTLPEVPEGRNWTSLIDTNQPEISGKDEFEFGTEYTVTPRSLLLFKLQKEDQA
jgi:glycogen operon protein